MTAAKRERALQGASKAHGVFVKAQAAAQKAKQARDAALQRAWDAGATLPELADATGITKQAISQALNRPSGVRGGYQRRGERSA